MTFFIPQFVVLPFFWGKKLSNGFSFQDLKVDRWTSFFRENKFSKQFSFASKKGTFFSTFRYYYKVATVCRIFRSLIFFMNVTLTTQSSRKQRSAKYRQNGTTWCILYKQRGGTATFCNEEEGRHHYNITTLHNLLSRFLFHSKALYHTFPVLFFWCSRNYKHKRVYNIPRAQKVCRKGRTDNTWSWIGMQI